MNFRSNLKKLFASMVVVSAVFLSGCSDTPSASDIKKDLNKKAGDYFEVVDVEILEIKPFGEKDGMYHVKFKYETEIVKALSEAKTPDQIRQIQAIKRLGDYKKGDRFEKEGNIVISKK